MPHARSGSPRGRPHDVLRRQAGRATRPAPPARRGSREHAITLHNPERDLMHEQHSGVELRREVEHRLALTYDYELWRPHRAAFARLIEDRRLCCVLSDRWGTDSDDLESVLGHAVGYGQFRWGSEALLDLESETGCQALVTLDDGVLTAYVAAREHAQLADPRARAGTSIARSPLRSGVTGRTERNAHRGRSRFPPGATSVTTTRGTS
jgi:hypothetical protein